MNLASCVALSILLQTNEKYKDRHEYALDIFGKGSCLRKTVGAQPDAIETIWNIMKRLNPDATIVDACNYVEQIRVKLKEIGLFELGLSDGTMNAEGQEAAGSMFCAEKDKAERYAGVLGQEKAREKETGKAQPE
jgi:hypothetical protein